MHDTIDLTQTDGLLSMSYEDILVTIFLDEVLDQQEEESSDVPEHFENITDRHAIARDRQAFYDAQWYPRYRNEGRRGRRRPRIRRESIRFAFC